MSECERGEKAACLGVVVGVEWWLLGDGVGWDETAEVGWSGRLLSLSEFIAGQTTVRWSVCLVRKKPTYRCTIANLDKYLSIFIVLIRITSPPRLVFFFFTDEVLSSI